MKQTTNKNELVSEEVRVHLQNLINELGVSNYIITISEGAVKGDNYLGIIAKVEVKGFDIKNGEDVALHFIIKSAPRQGMVREMGPLRAAYDREIFVYQNVFPEYRKLQTERQIKNPFSSYPKFYNSIMEDKNEALIMEDMKTLGFKMLSRYEPLNYDHALLVMHEYGKLHALSFALLDQKPEVFEELSRNLHDNFFSYFSTNVVVKQGMVLQTGRALKAFDPVNDEEVYKRFKKFNETAFDKMLTVMEEGTTGNYSVIVHGDSWVNNMLFKYEDSNTYVKPTNVCLLDWQLSKIGSPVLDLSYFIFTCTDKELRDVHYNDLIQTYYGSLSAFLRVLGSDPNKLFPYSILQEHLKKYSLYGLLMSTMVLHLMVSNVEEIPNFHSDSTNAEELLESLRYETKNLEQYHIRIRDMVHDFVKLEYAF